MLPAVSESSRRPVALESAVSGSHTPLLLPVVSGLRLPVPGVRYPHGCSASIPFPTPSCLRPALGDPAGGLRVGAFGSAGSIRASSVVRQAQSAVRGRGVRAAAPRRPIRGRGRGGGRGRGRHPPDLQPAINPTDFVPPTALPPAQHVQSDGSAAVRTLSDDDARRREIRLGKRPVDEMVGALTDHGENILFSFSLCCSLACAACLLMWYSFFL